MRVLVSVVRCRSCMGPGLQVHVDLTSDWLVSIDIRKLFLKTERIRAPRGYSYGNSRSVIWRRSRLDNDSD